MEELLLKLKKILCITSSTQDELLLLTLEMVTEELENVYFISSPPSFLVLQMASFQFQSYRTETLSSIGVEGVTKTYCKTYPTHIQTIINKSTSKNGKLKML